MEGFDPGVFGQSTLTQEPPQSVAYAGIFRRFMAMFIDSIIVNIICGVIGSAAGIISNVIGMDLSALQSIDPTNPTIPAEVSAAVMDYAIILFLVIFLATWFYYAGFESSGMQGTLGKRAMGIKVTDMDGDQIGFGTATGRFLGKAISSLILGIGYFMAAFTSKKQALHDMIAGTVVVMR